MSLRCRRLSLFKYADTCYAARSWVYDTLRLFLENPPPCDAHPDGVRVCRMDVTSIIVAQKAARIKEKKLHKLQEDAAKKEQRLNQALVSRACQD